MHTYTPLELSKSNSYAHDIPFLSHAPKLKV